MVYDPLMADFSNAMLVLVGVLVIYIGVRTRRMITNYKKLYARREER
jgi:hypothetical protein